jgi:hypothetical protein
MRLIGKETERGWDQAEDVSTLLPSLIHYRDASSEPASSLQKILHRTSLSDLQRRTGLSRHTILRVRRGQNVRTRSLRMISKAVVDVVRRNEQRTFSLLRLTSGVYPPNRLTT